MRRSIVIVCLSTFSCILAAQLPCTQEDFTSDFRDGKLDEHWIPSTGDGSLNPVGAGKPGIYLQIGAEQKDMPAASIGFKSKKTYTYPLTVTATMQGADVPGIISAMVFWPTYGRGEIDLELLGNRPDSIMCPIWAPFDIATTPEPKELDPASAPDGTEWPVAQKGPAVKFFPPFSKASPYDKSAIIDGFAHTDSHTYVLTYTDTIIEGKVDGKDYIVWTKGEDPALWPGDGAMHVEFSLWRKPDQEAWLGKYVYPGNPTTMTVNKVVLSGCATGDETPGDPDQNHSDQRPAEQSDIKSDPPPASSQPGPPPAQSSSPSPSSSNLLPGNNNVVTQTKSITLDVDVTVTSSKAPLSSSASPLPFWEGYSSISIPDPAEKDPESVTSSVAQAPSAASTHVATVSQSLDNNATDSTTLVDGQATANSLHELLLVVCAVLAWLF